MQTSDAFKPINLYAYPVHFLNRYIIVVFKADDFVCKLFELPDQMVVVFDDCLRVLGHVVFSFYFVMFCVSVL